MEIKTVAGLHEMLKGSVVVKDSGVEVVDENRLRGEPIDALIYNAVFGADGGVAGEARRLITLIGEALKTRSASIHGLYMAMGRGECAGFRAES